jgi:hypothetical protein
VTLRNYQPVAWVLYQRVIDQSKADIFIKPGITYNINFISNSHRRIYNLKTAMKLYRIFKLQICFHTVDIFTIHVLSEIDQHYQLNNYTLVSLICDMTKFVNQSSRTYNHKTTYGSFIVAFRKRCRQSLATSWIIKNWLPMFLGNFRIKLPIVFYNYINKICIYNFKLQEGITEICGILFFLSK